MSHNNQIWSLPKKLFPDSILPSSVTYWNDFKNYRSKAAILYITIRIARIRTVFSVNSPPQSSTNSLRFGPSNSRTRIMSPWSMPDHIIFGIPPATHYFAKSSNVFYNGVSVENKCFFSIVTYIHLEERCILWPPPITWNAW